MRELFISLLLLFSATRLFAQDTLFYDENWEKVQIMHKSKYFTVSEYAPNDTNRLIQKTYLRGGSILIEDHYSRKDGNSKWKADGKCKNWNIDQQLTSEINYSKGNYHGEFLTFWENGQPKRVDEYKDDELIEGHCYDITGKEVTYFEYETLPAFPGGEVGLMQYLAKNVGYPIVARRNNTQGTVHIKFIVDEDGSILDPKVIKSVSPDIDEEALRVVKNMPQWIPGKIDGEPTKRPFTLPIRFRLM